MIQLRLLLCRAVHGVGFLQFDVFIELQEVCECANGSHRSVVSATRRGNTAIMMT